MLKSKFVIVAAAVICLVVAASGSARARIERGAGDGDVEEDFLAELDELYDEAEEAAAAPGSTGQASKPGGRAYADHGFDEEEFEGFENLVAAEDDDEAAAAASTKSGRKKKADALNEPKLKAGTGLFAGLMNDGPRPNRYIEYVIVTVLVAYLVNFFIGKSRNAAIADAWVSQHAPIFEKQFSRCTHDDGEVLEKVQHHIYRYYATGRINCQSATATLTLRKRHDLFATIFELFSDAEDTFEISVVMDRVEPFVWAVLPTKRERALRSQVSDLKRFTSFNANDGPCDSLGIATDCSEMTSKFLEPPVVEALDRFAKFVRVVHVTDQSALNPDNPTMCHFVFAIPSSPKDAEATEVLTRMALTFFIDKAASVRLSSRALSRAKSKRADVEKEKLRKEAEARKEAAVERKTEKLIKEREKMEARMRRMSPEARKKFEAKQERIRAKKEQAQRMKSMTVRA